MKHSTAILAEFQSAPRDCSRGDRAGATFMPGLLFQSAPRDCSRGDTPAPASATSPPPFQSAPRDCSRGDNGTWCIRHAARRFNPRPAIARGAICQNDAHSPIPQVSIRAPRLLAGRFIAAPPSASRPQFQSAPRDCSRGDSCAHRSRFRISPFQSAPRDCSRGDPASHPHHETPSSFNPRPAIARGAIAVLATCWLCGN